MKRITALKILIDSCAFSISIGCGLYLYKYLRGDIYSESLFILAVGYVIFIFSLYGSGAYTKHRELIRISDLVSSLSGALFAILVYVLLSFMLKIEYSRIITVAILIILPFSVVFGRLLANYFFGKFDYFKNSENIIIYGAGKLGEDFEILINKIETSYNVVGFLDDQRRGGRVLGVFDDLNSLASTTRIDRLIVAISELKDGHISKIESVASRNKIKVSYISSPTLMRNNHLKFRDFAGITMVTNYSRNENLLFLFAKRILDLTVAVIGLLLSSPFWIILFMIAKVSNSGPLLFTQDRVGMSSRLFKIYKFRSMYADVNVYDHCPTDSDDPRITPIGKYLRKYSIDELPQLLNVIKGEMSLVGPRPEMPFIVQNYNSFEKQRLRIKPGVTGLWQISPGRKHEITDNLEYDIYYLEHQSLTLDTVILVLTGVFVFKSFTH
jgi:exopolysaccharide biosynthesis polyprenyl glycosylphosphotransferase